MIIQPEETTSTPQYIAVFFDLLNDTYICSKYPFHSPIEAIEGFDDKGQERYKLIQTIEVK